MSLFMFVKERLVKLQHCVQKFACCCQFLLGVLTTWNPSCTKSHNLQDFFHPPGSIDVKFGSLRKKPSLAAQLLQSGFEMDACRM
jgi:hypothetical protein